METNSDKLDARCSKLRIDIKSVTSNIATLRGELSARMIDLKPASDAGEVIANVTLSLRHLEDAAMRLGKVIQAYDGGISVYDKNDASRAGVSVTAGGQVLP